MRINKDKVEHGVKQCQNEGMGLNNAKMEEWG